MNNSFTFIVDKLKKAKKVALFAHTNPDGDALGSMAAAKGILEFMGKEAKIILAEKPPEKFSYLFDEEPIISPESIDADTALALDCGDSSRLGSLLPLFMSAKMRLVVDHHCAGEEFGDGCFRDEESAACCELVYELADSLIGRLPRAAMKGIYTGLSTDTGHFKFSNVTKKTLMIAALVVGMGLDHRSITNTLYDTIKLGKLRFLSEAYSKTELLSSGRISFLYCSDDDLEKYSITHSDIEELPATLLNIEGVLVSILVKDSEEGKKFSLRSKDSADVSAIAKSFGGGGHVNAAGFSSDGSVADVTDSLVKKIEAALEQRKL